MQPEVQQTRIARHPTSADWPFRVRPLAPQLGVEIIGVDLARGVDDALFAAIYDAFLRHQVLLFGEQDLPPGRQVEFARHFGEVQIHVMNQYHSTGYPELYRLSNLDENGNPSGKHPDRGTQEWHTDGSWRERTGQATILYAEIAPEQGGGTQWCDMYGAYERLSPAWKERLSKLQAVHNLDFSRTRRHGEDPMTDAQRREVPPVAHPIIRTHPETGRKCVFLGDHAEYIQGMDYDAGRALIEEVNAMIVHPDLTYTHRWKPGELIAWDNRCLLHKAGQYDEATQRRVIRRCTILGDVPR